MQVHRALWLLAALIPAPALEGNVTHYVAAGATGAADGTSWSDAFPTISAALAVAEPGDQVWVAEGTYTPDPAGTDRSLSFLLVDAVEIYGGFAGSETCLAERDWTANETILSGDLAGNDSIAPSCGPPAALAEMDENSWHVVRAENVGPGAVLDGFTISGGNAEGAGDDRRGGGILIRFSSPQIRNCIVTRNRTGSGGGGFDGDGGDGAGICAVSSAATIRDTTVCSNVAGEGLGSDADPGRGGRGGGIALIGCAGAQISACTIRDNLAGSGAATDDPPPSGPTSHTGGDGGGIFIEAGSAIRVERCVLEDNRGGRGGINLDTGDGGRGGAGGGLAAIGSELLITDGLFEGNTSGASMGVATSLPSGDGGGAYLAGCTVRIIRTEFLGNRTADGCENCGIGGGSGRGGAIRLVGGLATTIVSSRFAANETGENQREFIGDESGDGGAIACTDGPLQVASSVFIANRTGFGGVGEDGRNSGSGGAIWLDGVAPSEISNSVFAGNATGDSGPGQSGIGTGIVGSGGAVASALAGATALTISNCTLIDNRTGVLSGAGTPGSVGGVLGSGTACVHNSILFGNADPSGATQGAQLQGTCAEYCCVEGWTVGSPTNFGADPQLLDPIAPLYDLRLASSSPCRDSALAALVPPDRGDQDGDGDLLESVPYDVAGERRFLGAVPPGPDIGAHEFQESSFAIRSAASGDAGGDALPVDPATGEGSCEIRLELAEDPSNPGFPSAVRGVRIRGHFDPSRLQFISAEPGGDVAALNGGEGPAGFGVVTCGDLFIVEVLTPAPGEPIVTGVPREVVILRFAAAAGGGPPIPVSGASTEIWLRDGADCSGVPPAMVLNSVIVDAGEVTAAPGALPVRLIPTPRSFPFVRGDCNADAAFDIADPISLLAHLFAVGGGSSPLPCRDACDSNDDGKLQISDAIYSLGAIVGGSSPPLPWPDCGVDPTEDPICCSEFAPCR